MVINDLVVESTSAVQHFSLAVISLDIITY